MIVFAKRFDRLRQHVLARLDVAFEQAKTLKDKIANLEEKTTLHGDEIQRTTKEIQSHSKTLANLAFCEDCGVVLIAGHRRTVRYDPDPEDDTVPVSTACKFCGQAFLRRKKEETRRAKIEAAKAEARKGIALVEKPEDLEASNG